MNYEDACRAAAVAQGLEAFLTADGWTVEQTGGFTMVATREVGPFVWSVTAEEDGFMAVLQTLEAWTDTSGEAIEDRTGLTLEQALALGAPMSPDDALRQVSHEAADLADGEAISAYVMLSAAVEAFLRGMSAEDILAEAHAS